MSALLYNYNRGMTRSVNEFETYLHNEILRLGTKSTFTYSFFLTQLRILVLSVSIRHRGKA